MLSIDVSVENLQAAFVKMQTLPDEVGKIMLRVSYRIAAKVKDTAAWYAPKRPTQQEIVSDATRTMKRRHYKQGTIKRKIRELKKKMRKHPPPMGGALQSSITFKANAEEAEVFVPSNSPAGKYAIRMHDERYKTWWKRGIGTIAKGEQAREKFIERAVKDNVDNGNIPTIIEGTISRLISGL